MTDLDRRPEPYATDRSTHSTRSTRAPRAASRDPLQVPVGLDDVRDLPADAADALAAAGAVVPALGAV